MRKSSESTLVHILTCECIHIWTSRKFIEWLNATLEFQRNVLYILPDIKHQQWTERSMYDSKFKMDNTIEYTNICTVRGGGAGDICFNMMSLYDNSNCYSTAHTSISKCRVYLYKIYKLTIDQKLNLLLAVCNVHCADVLMGIVKSGIE